MSAEGERILRFAGLVPVDEAPQAGERVEWSAGDETAQIVADALASPDEGPLSARLRRVEQERDEVATDFQVVRSPICTKRKMHGYVRPATERQATCPKCLEKI